jgi:AcrR family transcriptional regulator
MPKRLNQTKAHIIQTATRMFLEQGYSDTSVKAICRRLDISTGNLTFHFPTKEHMLAVLVRMLCDFQWAMMRQEVQGESAPLDAVCMELITMASICEENPIVKDFYLSAYTHPMTLQIIRQSDTARARVVYGGWCDGWSPEQYEVAEIVSSGIEYASLMTTGEGASFNSRIGGALDALLKVFRVPGDFRAQVIQKTLSRDYRSLGLQIFSRFVDYIDSVDDLALEKYIIV